MASMLAPCDFHPKQKICALRICGSLDLPLRWIQISHSPKLPMNITLVHVHQLAEVISILIQTTCKNIEGAIY